jgi:hypothetical protein
MELGALTPAVQREVAAMGVKIAVISSSSGKQIKQSVADSPENTLPESCFFGDEKRLSYRIVANANYGMSDTLWPGFAAIVDNAARVFELVVLGAVLGTRKQHLTNAQAAWQQGKQGCCCF